MQGYLHFICKSVIIALSKKGNYMTYCVGLLLNEGLDLTVEQCLSKIYENLSSMQPKSVKERHLIKHSLGLVKEAKLKVGYVEKHHIVPKCFFIESKSRFAFIPGNRNHKDNLVYLTGREHFICHLLLVKMLLAAVK